MRCDGYKCIRKIHVCDGVSHCDDGADEYDCSTTAHEGKVVEI